MLHLEAEKYGVWQNEQRLQVSTTALWWSIFLIFLGGLKITIIPMSVTILCFKIL